MSRSKNRSLALIAGILACVVWASAVVVVHRLAKAFGPISAIGWESLLGGAFLLSILILRRRGRSMFDHPRAYYYSAGPAWVMHQSLLFAAIGSIPSPPHLMIVGLINYLWPILTVLFSIPILGKRFSKLVFLGLMIALVGIAIAKTALHEFSSIRFADMMLAHPKAYTLAFFGAIAWALYSNCVKRYANPRAESALPLFMLFSAIPLLLFGRILGEQGSLQLESIFLLCLWSIFTTLAVVAWDYGIRNGNMVQLAIFSMFIPILSTLIVCFITAIPISSSIVIAGTAVTVGAWICQRSEIQNRKGLIN